MENKWAEAERPRRVADCIAPDSLKSQFQSYVDKKFVPDMLLTGRAGIGKTTVAKAMLEELGYDCLLINATLKGNVDTLRTDITQFASSVSINGGRKYVILDEADGLTSQAQAGLRAFMDEFASNCGFILTCNYLHKLIEPIRSRVAVIDFSFKKSDYPALMSQFFKRVKEILARRSVEFDTKVVMQVIAKYFPDFRKVLNELQAAASSGKIDSSALAARTNIDDLIKAMKAKSFVDVRRWVGEHSDWDSVAIMREFFDQSEELLAPNSIVDLVYLIARYQYQAAFVADQEINLAAFVAEAMTTVEWK